MQLSEKLVHLSSKAKSWYIYAVKQNASAFMKLSKKLVLLCS